MRRRAGRHAPSLRDLDPWRPLALLGSVLLGGVLLGGVALALLVGAAPAHAHGGGFGPPPTPHAKGPPRGGGPPAFVDPGFGGPIVTPGSSGEVTPRNPGSKRRTAITPSYEASWRLWWALNREFLLRPRHAGRLSVVTVAPTGSVPAAPSAAGAAAWEAERLRLAAEVAVPALVQLLEPGVKAPDDVKASALIALGKLTTVPKHIEIFFHHLGDKHAADIIRESAALGLGLLRRSSPALRFPSRHLDPVRGRLLQVFDRYIAGKRTQVPIRVRVFAMFSIGLLGDQPFRDDALHKNGMLISKLMWERLQVVYRDRELHIAVLTALGLQPGAGIPDGVIDGLKGIIDGKKVLGHQWDHLKRAHAVTAVARLGGVRGNVTMLRLANDRGKPLLVRMAAAIALAHRAPQMRGPERSAAVRMVLQSFKLEQEMLGVGLSNIALGRMVGAALAADSTRVLTHDKADARLLKRAERAPWYLRGFAALGLALAAREAKEAPEAASALRRNAGRVLLAMARDGKAQWSVRGAGVVGLGLLGDGGCTPSLLALLQRTHEDPELRAHAALALGQIGAGGDDVVKALEAVVLGAEPEVVRANAALALSLLGRKEVAPRLLERLEADTSTRLLTGTARALGRLGDLSGAEPLVALARRDGARPLVRAMALVALGRLLDPEARPSMLRLTLGTCYPARTRSLQEAFTIL